MSPNSKQDKLSSKYGPKYTVGAIPEGDVGKMLVLNAGDAMRAEAKFGYVSIRALSETEREVRVKRNGEVETVFVISPGLRDVAFHGLTGIYQGANYGPRSQESQSIIYQEGKLFLNSWRDVELKLQEVPSMGYVVSKEGFVVGIWDPHYPGTIHIDLFQIVLTGGAKIPSDCRGKITLERKGQKE